MTEVLEAIERLRAKELITAQQSSHLFRVARRELVSVRFELRVLLYAGVLLIASGAGLFLKENHERIGPVVLVSLFALASAACLAHTFRRSRPFSWEKSPVSSIATDYALLLGLLLFASGLAYVETQFRVLGPKWPYHLLIVSVIDLAAAYRFDSRIVLSLALTSFAAWRGVSIAVLTGGSVLASPSLLRANALVCGALFLAAAALSERLAKKRHFAPVWRTFGLLLCFSGLLHGVWGGSPSNWLLWELILMTFAGLVLAISNRRRRSLDFSIAAVSAYVGLLRILSELASGSTYHALVAVTSIGVLLLLLRTHRHLKEAG